MPLLKMIWNAFFPSCCERSEQQRKINRNTDTGEKTWNFISLKL